MSYLHYDAPGMLSLVRTVEKLDFSKVLIVGRDGAAVMVKLVKLIQKFLSPFAIGVYCGNHGG